MTQLAVPCPPRQAQRRARPEPGEDVHLQPTVVGWECAHVNRHGALSNCATVRSAEKIKRTRDSHWRCVQTAVWTVEDLFLPFFIHTRYSPAHTSTSREMTAARRALVPPRTSPPIDTSHQTRTTVNTRRRPRHRPPPVSRGGLVSAAPAPAPTPEPGADTQYPNICGSRAPATSAARRPDATMPPPSTGNQDANCPTGTACGPTDLRTPSAGLHPRSRRSTHSARPVGSDRQC